MSTKSTEPEIPLTGGGRTSVSRIGDVVHRETGPWARTVHALLRHLEAEGFAGAPRVIGSGSGSGSGFDEKGRETLSFVHGVSLHPGPWPDEAMFNLGKMLADFHRASASLCLPRSRYLRTIADGYGLNSKDRAHIVPNTSGLGGNWGGGALV